MGGETGRCIIAVIFMPQSLHTALDRYCMSTNAMPSNGDNDG